MTLYQENVLAHGLLYSNLIRNDFVIAGEELLALIVGALLVSPLRHCEAFLVSCQSGF